MHTNTMPVNTRVAAEEKIKAAELAIAEAGSAVCAAVAAGGVEPCSCLFGDLGMAQKQLEDLRQHLNGHGKSRRGDGDGPSAMIIEALRRTTQG
jgi:hypothetical protein